MRRPFSERIADELAVGAIVLLLCSAAVLVTEFAPPVGPAGPTAGTAAPGLPHHAETPPSGGGGGSNGTSNATGNTSGGTGGNGTGTGGSGGNSSGNSSGGSGNSSGNSSGNGSGPLNSTIRVAPALGNLTPMFFSLSAQSIYLESPTTVGLIRNTPFTYFRWGPEGEYTNVTSGIVYNDAGQGSPVGTDNISAFISFVQKVHGHAMISVPGEIDSPSVAVATMRYVEGTLGFHPDYWSIGNEPQNWVHWGKPWTSWRTTDNSTVTPLEYAREVQTYIHAMRAYDPTARFIGIQSAGGTLWEATTWIAPVAEIDGPNISAVAYHPYPGGYGTTSGSLSDFFATLSNPSLFPNGYAAAQSAIDTACRCRIPLWVGEYNSAIGGTFSTYVGGYAEVPYIGAGLALSLRDQVPMVTYFTLWPTLIAGTTPNPAYYLYSTFFENLTLGSVHNVSITNAPAQVVGVETTNGSRTSLFVADANPFSDVSIVLNASTFPDTGNTTVWYWDPSTPFPTVEQFAPGTLPAQWLVQPQGVLLIDAQ